MVSATKLYLHQVNNVCENDSKDYNKTDPPPSSLEKDYV